MPALSAYINTEDVALKLIKAKGYQFWYAESSGLCYAEKEGWDFAAGGFMELLGIITVFEELQPKRYSEYWWQVEGPQLVNDVPRQPVAYKSVTKK